VTASPTSDGPPFFPTHPPSIRPDSTIQWLDGRMRQEGLLASLPARERGLIVEQPVRLHHTQQLEQPVRLHHTQQVLAVQRTTSQSGRDTSPETRTRLAVVSPGHIGRSAPAQKPRASPQPTTFGGGTGLHFTTVANSRTSRPTTSWEGSAPVRRRRGAQSVRRRRGATSETGTRVYQPRCRLRPRCDQARPGRARKREEPRASTNCGAGLTRSPPRRRRQGKRG
jgi:hypothetical protein